MAEPKAVPTPTTEADRAAAAVCRLARRAVEDDRPLFLVVFYRHEGEKLDFLAAVRQGLRQRGLQNRTLDPGRNPDHGTGRLYPLLAADDDQTIHLVTDLARGEDGAFDPAFLDYLNLHRDRINREKLRWVLVLHDSEAEPFLRQAGDLWDFRQRTFWLERPAEPRGEALWQELGERTENLPLGEDERQDIEEHLATVRQQVELTSDPEEHAGLLIDLAQWLLRRQAAGIAVDVALEGLGFAEEGSEKLRLALEGTAGLALFQDRQLGEALRHLEQALKIAREIGDATNEATILNNIFTVYKAWGRYDDALRCLQHSLSICREIGARSGEVSNLNNIASIYLVQGRYDEALQKLHQSLHIQQDIGDPAREATTLNNIAMVYHAWGRYDDALPYLQQSLQIQQEVGERAGEATTLNNIAQIYHAWGRNDEALQYLQQSLQIQREVGDPAREATTLNNIGGIYHAWGRDDQALQNFRQSLQIQQEVGDRTREATTLNNISQAYRALGRDEDALRNLQQSLAISREVGDRAGEAITLNNIAGIYEAWGRYDDALQHLQQGRHIQQEIGDRAGEALTSWNLGREYERREEWDTALLHLRRAVELEAKLDHPDLEADTAYLKKLEEKLADRSRV